MPDEEGHVTHFTVPALPYKREVVKMVERGDGSTEVVTRVASGLPELLEDVTPENVHPEYNPAYECEDSEGEED